MPGLPPQLLAFTVLSDSEGEPVAFGLEVAAGWIQAIRH